MPISAFSGCWPLKIVAGHADAVGLRRVERGRGNRDRGQADQRVERGHELGQRRHLDLERDQGADRAADHDCGQDLAVGEHARHRHRGADGDRHADHAYQVALPRRLGRGKTPQCEDEADRRDQVGEAGDLLAHPPTPSGLRRTRRPTRRSLARSWVTSSSDTCAACAD
jgi:hypothetical protein